MNPGRPLRCDENAGGCGRSEQEGAVLRDGSALCEACKEAIAEAEADGAQRLKDAEALADAFAQVGKLNHYMVGVTFNFKREELEAAEQLLIDRQNAGPQKGKAFQALERALDEVENARFVRFVQTEKAKAGKEGA
jgi:flavin-binding protein dodecin